MNHETLDIRVTLANKLADVSGNIIKQYFRQSNLASETKITEVSSIVTIADRLAENAMVDLIKKECPDDGIIREEGENINSNNGYAWVLDPIDGTSSFVKGLPIFGTLIGLVDLKNNLSLLGCVNQPILQERWLGIRGKPTIFNDKIINNPYKNNHDYPLAKACLTSTTPLMFITLRQQAIASHLQTVCRRISFGGDCYNYVSLAMGWTAMPIIVLESDLKYYDFCALIPIIEGVGGIITDWTGNALNSHSTEVLAASNLNLHQQALNVILSQG
ncbi:probable inositol monophosphatase family [Crocosphaera subtropica ATCC 51142]|uniref:Probable inositol monophosphatase family n=1 Tax=Crocosphaera subtropica (strain ATCC 51142 / BH68) TaxID=43989 RepID=B1WY57_CROS5|nr:inositol monophosphatase family protein [Crocosphaera subtropica]ACB52641.1 probable inositol monophosphatase family [Crocosphaera subtropica ATCC 51142]